MFYICAMETQDISIEQTLKQMRHIVVDKVLLRSFFEDPTHEPTEAELGEVLKVINLVLCVHFSKYYSRFDDLRSQALLTILERRGRYDSAYPPLGFCYTIARNEAGNSLRRWVREAGLDSVGYSCRGARTKEVAPTELSELLLYMSGDVPFERIVVPQKLAGALLVFCERGSSKYSGDVCKERVIDLLLNVIKLK